MRYGGAGQGEGLMGVGDVHTSKVENVWKKYYWFEIFTANLQLGWNHSDLKYVFINYDTPSNLGLVHFHSTVIHQQSYMYCVSVPLNVSRLTAI